MFDCSFATDAPGGSKVSMMVATRSIHGSIFAVVARRKRWPGRLCNAEFPKLHRSVGFVKGRIESNQEPSTLDVANALTKRCQSTVLTVIATPKGSKGSLGRGERANLIIQGHLRAFREAVSMKCKIEVEPDHVLMGWMVRHCAWVVNNFQVKGTGRTPYRSIRGKNYTGEVVPFGEVSVGRNHSEDGAKLHIRWMRGVFVGKLDRTDEFLLLTPTGAMKTRCVRRLEGDSAWDSQFLNLCVGSSWNATARSMQQKPTIQQKGELESGRRAKRVYTCDRTFWTSTDVLKDAQVVLEMGNTQRSAEQELNKKWWTKVTQLNSRHLEIRKKLCKSLIVSLKKRKIGEPDINPGGPSRFNGRYTQEG